MNIHDYFEPIAEPKPYPHLYYADKRDDDGTRYVGWLAYCPEPCAEINKITDMAADEEFPPEIAAGMRSRMREDAELHFQAIQERRRMALEA